MKIINNVIAGNVGIGNRSHKNFIFVKLYFVYYANIYDRSFDMGKSSYYFIYTNGSKKAKKM